MRDLLQPMHLVLILLVFIVFFGGKKLADVGKGLGEGIRNFKSSLKGEDEPQPPTGGAATPEEKKQA
jgi:sec-independent protein translocase protein TatA